jgi:hypothetical protein
VLKAEWEAYARRLGYPDERAMFKDLYERQGVSVIDLGDRLGFTRGTIARRLSLLGIVKRSRGGANNEFTQRFRLWRFDQRLLHCYSSGALEECLQISSVTLKSYLNSLKEIKWRRP